VDSGKPGAQVWIELIAFASGHLVFRIIARLARFPRSNPRLLPVDGRAPNLENGKELSPRGHHDWPLKRANRKLSELEIRFADITTDLLQPRFWNREPRLNLVVP
jgi:hypothetical protein